MGALRSVLRPLIKFALAKRIPIQSIVEEIKTLYVIVSQDEFSLLEKRLTNSRISVLTGLQRKDIKLIREHLGAKDRTAHSKTSLSRLIALWKSSPTYQDEKGQPAQLQRSGSVPSFETLVSAISQDVHPRTLLDELLELEHVKLEDNKVTLTQSAYLPSKDFKALLGYFGDNLGDHCTVAVENVLTAPDPGPNFERAVHYNQLTQASLIELEDTARRIQQEALEKINIKARELQDIDKNEPDAKNRFRCGSFILCKQVEDQTIGTSKP